MKNTIGSQGKVIGIDFNEEEKNKIFSIIDRHEITFLESKKGDSFGDFFGNKEAFVILIPWRHWIRLSNSMRDTSLKKFYIKKIENSFFGDSDIFTECVVAISSKLLKEKDELKRIIDEAKGIYNFISNLKKEIALYKDLYFRKANHLDFLDDFFKTVTPPLRVKEILEKGFLKIRDYFAINSLCILIPGENNGYKFYVTNNKNFWINYVEKKLNLKNSLEVVALEIEVQTNKDWEIVDVSPSLQNFKVFISIDTTHMGYDDFAVLEMAIDHFCLLIQRALEYEKLSSFAYVDSLTGVGNRHYFDMIIKQEIKRHERLGSKFSVVMIDIDHFKDINDRFGHGAGDLVLNQLANIIKDNAREIDYVIRYGGEEFLVILPHTNKESAHIFAERLRKRVENHNFIIDNGKQVKITISIGISEFDPRADKNFEAVLKDADDALYNSKERGRNRVSVI